VPGAPRIRGLIDELRAPRTSSYTLLRVSDCILYSPHPAMVVFLFNASKW